MRLGAIEAGGTKFVAAVGDENGNRSWIVFFSNNKT